MFGDIGAIFSAVVSNDAWEIREALKSDATWVLGFLVAAIGGILVALIYRTVPLIERNLERAVMVISYLSIAGIIFWGVIDRFVFSEQLPCSHVARIGLQCILELDNSSIAVALFDEFAGFTQEFFGFFLVCGRSKTGCGCRNTEPDETDGDQCRFEIFLRQVRLHSYFSQIRAISIASIYRFIAPYRYTSQVNLP